MENDFTLTDKILSIVKINTDQRNYAEGFLYHGCMFLSRSDLYYRSTLHFEGKREHDPDGKFVLRFLDTDKGYHKLGTVDYEIVFDTYEKAWKRWSLSGISFNLKLVPKE